MSDNKPITDDIRKFLGGALYNSPSCFDRATVLCDYIDAMHKKLQDDHATLERECAEMRDFCERVEKAAQAREDVTLFGADYKALLLDADGVPIHVGDVMKGEKVGGGFGEPFEVVGYIMSNGELEPMDEHGCPRKHEYLHHHHAPTVADVLREFTRTILNQKAEYREQNIAKYAAKLRLAGDAE